MPSMTNETEYLIIFSFSFLNSNFMFDFAVAKMSTFHSGGGGGQPGSTVGAAALRRSQAAPPSAAASRHLHLHHPNLPNRMRGQCRHGHWA